MDLWTPKGVLVILLPTVRKRHFEQYHFEREQFNHWGFNITEN